MLCPPTGGSGTPRFIADDAGLQVVQVLRIDVVRGDPNDNGNGPLFDATQAIGSNLPYLSRCQRRKGAANLGCVWTLDIAPVAVQLNGSVQWHVGGLPA